MLLDTCILIDFLRGKPKAQAFIMGLDDAPTLSAITVAELFAGVRDGNERVALDEMIAVSQIVPVNSEIARMAGLFVRQYRASHGVGLADALIAASAKEVQMNLATLNTRHFPMFLNLQSPY